MQHWTRRDLLRAAGVGAAAVVLGPTIPAVARAVEADEKAPYTLPKLPYAFDALEPHIDARTMQIHHDLHHGAYVKNLNDIFQKAKLAAIPLDELMTKIATLPMAIRVGVRNNGGGHFNHSMFWQQMAKDGGGEPKGELAKAIDASFGSFAKFQDTFSKAGLGRFGSGWAWVVVGPEKLEVVSSANQDNPFMTGKKAILGLDVWEHAYYLKYQNRRGEYIKAWWNVVNWKDVAERYAAAKK